MSAWPALPWVSCPREGGVLETVYQRQRDRGKHHLVALSHVANKMLHVVFSVLKNNRPYAPQLPKGATP